jgi:hypothetical protein
LLAFLFEIHGKFKMLSSHGCLTLANGYKLSKDEPSVENVLVSSICVKVFEHFWVGTGRFLLLEVFSFFLSSLDKEILGVLRALSVDLIVLKG